MSTAPAIDERMLFDEPPGESSKEVLSFPAPKKDRVQDIVLKLLLDGQSYKDIAETVDLSEENVKKLARSTWAKQELAARLAANPGQSESALSNLLRVQAFDAINAVHDVLTGSHIPSKFQCAKWLLDKYLDGSEQSGKSPVPKDEQTLKLRLAELDKQIEAERKNQITL